MSLITYAPPPSAAPAPAGPRTLHDLFTAYLGDVALEHQASTQYQQRMFYQMVLQEFGPLPLEDVTPDLLRAWKAQLTTRYARSTVYRYMSFLSCALRYAVDCEWLAANPMAKIRKPSPGRGRVRFLTTAERDRLLGACRASTNPALYPLVVLALATGARKNELRRLRWSEVDFTHGMLRLLKTKGQTARSVPLLGEARQLLEALAQQRRPEVAWVFPGPHGRTPRDIEYAWTLARQQAQLTNFRFHDLRHTFASYMAMAGASLRDIADVLGHVKIAMTMQYAHLIEGHSTHAVERMIETFLTPQAPEEGARHA